MQPIPAAQCLAPLGYRRTGCAGSAFAPAALRASLAWGRRGERAVACPAIFPESITLLATVARGRVPSRRAGPGPRLRLRAAPTLRLLPWRHPSARSPSSRAMNSGKTVATRPTGFFVPTPPEARRGLW